MDWFLSKNHFEIPLASVVSTLTRVKSSLLLPKKNVPLEAVTAHILKETRENSIKLLNITETKREQALFIRDVKPSPFEKSILHKIKGIYKT
jgi:hypothetical protein